MTKESLRIRAGGRGLCEVRAGGRGLCGRKE